LEYGKRFLTEDHLPAYGTCAAWGSDTLHQNEFFFQPAQRGWHLDRRRFDAMLAREAANRGVALYRDSKFLNSQPGGSKTFRLAIDCQGEDEKLIETAFVVDATGRQAVFASQKGVQKNFEDRLLAVFVFFQFDPASPFTETYTLVEACEDGWWYSSLLPEGMLAVAFMSDSDVIKSRRLIAFQEWFDLLETTKHTKERVEKTQPAGAPLMYPASSHRLAQVTGNGWLAVGDAATTFDPLSSVGIMKGLRSGVLASYAIGDFFRGNTSGLEKYEALLKREFENYLATRAEYYRREKRWANSLFWQRRHERIHAEPDNLPQSMVQFTHEPGNDVGTGACSG
jgi:flavin-dependent dehydrogenase